MVTKRRTSTTEQERSEVSRYENDYGNRYDTIDIPSESQNTREFEFSTPKSASRVIYSDPAVTPKRETSEKDYMPSIQTMQYLNKTKETQKNSRERLESKTKVMLAVYMLAVIVLSAIVIATGIAVSNATERVNGLQSEFTAKAEVLDNQLNQIDKLSDPDYIAGRAYGNGMEYVENVNEVPLLEMHNSVSYEPRTNAFDAFCKWISSLIGG